MERNLEMVVALLGTLKAGGAYVPLDPGYPPDAWPTWSRTRSACGDDPGAAEGKVAQVRRPPSWPLTPSGKRSGPNRHAIQTRGRRGCAANSLAYVIYTSGSTGNPKGVMVEHRNVPACLLPRRAGSASTGGRLDTLSLVRVRLLGLGAVGRASLRRPGGGRAASDGPLARGVLSAAVPGTRDGAEPDPDAFRNSREPQEQARTSQGCAADRDLRWRGA